MSHLAYRTRAFPVLPCEMDPDRWFASPEKDPVLVESALDACTKCPWLAKCRDYAARVPGKHGVWAGRYYDGNASDLRISNG